MKLADCLNSTTLFTRAERGEILREFRAARQVGANVDQQIVAEGVVRARLDAAISEREAVRSEIMGGEPAAPDAMPEPAAPEVPAKMTAAERRAETERKRRDAKIKRREAAKKAIQTRKANAGALNIVQTIAAAGGLKDVGGDLRTIMGRPNYMVPVYGALRNEKTGMEPDRAREMLVEAGFLSEGATLNDLYAAIDQTVRGNPVMSARDVNEQLDRTEERKEQKYGDEPSVDQESSAPDDRIDDLGEKIGGARKDTAQKTGPRTTAQTPEDDTPAWRRRYVVMPSVGRDPQVFTIMDTRTKDEVREGYRRVEFATEAAAEAALPLFAVAQKHRVVSDGKDAWRIIRDVSDRKRATIRDGFASREDAMRYMAENAAQILETKIGFGEEILAKPDKVYRNGTAHRTGDVKGEDFISTFGFRGVEFGNWNSQDERQQVMNHAYDGLMDLAAILNVPPKALSLDGDLALAFGARGHGKSGARAHYERDYGVINLTKMKGAGSLAHEWWHALDHYLGRQDGKASSEKIMNKSGDAVFNAKERGADYVSHGFRYNSRVREELRKAHDAVMETIYRKAEKFVEDTARMEGFVKQARESLDARLRDVRQQISAQLDPKYYKRLNAPASREHMAAFDALADKLLNGEDIEVKASANVTSRGLVGLKRSNETLDQISAIYKAVRGRGGMNQGGLIDRVASALQTYKNAIDRFGQATRAEEKTKTVSTEFAIEAKRLDESRSEDYWSTPHEMAARAFSAFVEDTLATAQNRSDFLSFGSDNKFYREFNVRPFPQGAERAAIADAFKSFVDALKTREGKLGPGTALYQMPRTEKIAVAKDSLSDEQMVIPGAERVAAEGRKAAKAPQRSVAETPLFGGAQDATRDVKRADADREAKKQGRLFQAGDSARLRVAGEIDATVNLTPKDAAQRDAVANAVRVTLRRMVGKAAPDTAVFDSMMVGEQEITGAYSPLNNLLAVSLRSPDPIGTVRHETIHVLRQLGLIDETAWSALTQAAETGGWLDKHAIDERWGDELTREQALEEAIAEEFGVGLREGVWKTGSTKADAIFQRLAEFFRRVRVEIKRALSALGARDMSDADVAEAVFSLIERGAFRDDARSAIDRREEIALAGSEDDVVFQMAEAGASPAAATPAPKKARTLRAAIAALRPGSTDPLAKVRVPNDIGWARKTTVTPRTIAAYFPGFADAFFAGTRQFRARDKSISELTEIARPYLDLDQASKEKVGKVVEHGRMAGEVYAPAPDGTISVKNNVGQQIKGKIGGVTLMKDGETVRLTPDEARAYIAYRRVMDVALDKFRDQVVREWGFDPADAAAPKTESAVEDMIEAEQNAGERARLKTLAQVLSSIQQAKKRGYVPFTRYGSHYVSVTTMQDGRSYVVHREHIEPGITSSPNALGPLKRLTIPRLEEKAAALRARLAQIYPPDQGFEISELREVTPDNVGDLPNFSDLDAIIAAANLPADQAAAVQQAIGEVIQKRGFRAHFIKSRNIPGYSVDFERSLADYIVGISGYLARREHLPDIETAIASIPATQPELRKYAKDWNDYIQNPSEEFQGLRQAGFLWYLSGRFSSALVNLSQIPMVTQPYLSMFAGHAATAAAITRAYKDAALAIRPKTKSAGGAGLDVFSPDALPDDVRDVVKAALADGTLMPIETFQEMARARGRTPQSRSIGAKAQATQDAMAFMFQAAERTNRLVSFIAAYRLAQRPGVMERVNADLRDNPLWTRRRKDRRMDAAEFASFVVEETQFVLGKVNRTRMMRGPGALIFQFKSFSANYLELMARLGAFGGGVHRGGHRYAALASMMFAMFLVGGLMGLPGAEDGFDMIEALIKAATGIDPQFERRLRESAGSLAAMAAGALGASEETQASVSALAGRAAARGLAREAGVDVSQRIGMGRAAPKPTGTEHDDFWYRAIGLAGIPGSWVLRGIDIGLAAGRGDWWQAGIRAAPEAAADLMRARQLSTEGVKTIAKGRQVIMPDERLPDGTVAGGASNVTKRALGFQPTGISRAREQMNAVRRASEAPRDLFADFNLRRANIQAAINRASETLEKAQSDAQRATAEVAIKRETQRLDAVMREIEKYNDSAPDERRYKIANPGFAQQLKVANQGQRATQIKKVPMRARGSIEDIQARY